MKQPEAEAARDGFAKLIYGYIFDWILYRANSSLKPESDPKENRFVGILDIAGFESFVVNGFEQLCINLSNEKLQNRFNFDIFQNELSAYAEEGLASLDIKFEDNQKILDLIEGKGGQIISCCTVVGVHAMNVCMFQCLHGYMFACLHGVHLEHVYSLRTFCAH